MELLRSPESPVMYHKILNGALRLRKLLIRHFCLPRPEFLRKQYMPSTTGRLNAIEDLSYPWYVKPSNTRRWGPRVWMARLLGRKYPVMTGISTPHRALCTQELVLKLRKEKV